MFLNEAAFPFGVITGVILVSVGAFHDRKSERILALRAEVGNLSDSFKLIGGGNDNENRVVPVIKEGLILIQKGLGVGLGMKRGLHVPNTISRYKIQKPINIETEVTEKVKVVLTLETLN
jgi:hypothetical protein